MLVADPHLYVNTKLYPEYKHKSSIDIMREQMFVISKVLKGNSWNDLLLLPDKERDWLYDKCVEYLEKEEEMLEQAKRKHR